MPWSSILFADLITVLRGNLMLLSRGGCSLYLFHSERKSAGGDSFISMESLMPRLAEAASLLERSLAQVILVDRKFWQLQSWSTASWRGIYWPWAWPSRGLNRRIESKEFQKILRVSNVWGSLSCSFWFVSCSNCPCTSSWSLDAHFRIFKPATCRSSMSSALSDCASSFVASQVRSRCRSEEARGIRCPSSSANCLRHRIARYRAADNPNVRVLSWCVSTSPFELSHKIYWYLRSSRHTRNCRFLLPTSPIRTYWWERNLRRMLNKSSCSFLHPGWSVSFKETPAMLGADQSNTTRSFVVWLDFLIMPWYGR